MTGKKIILAGFFSASFIFIGPPVPASAAADFSEYLKVSYNVRKDGRTEVTQNISIVNNTTNKYVSDYALTIGSEKVEEVSASDRLGKLNPQIIKNGGQTEISVVFNDKIVGDKRSLNWTLSYLSDETAAKNGSVWEITIPRLTAAGDVLAYTVDLNVPLSFGREIYVSPHPDEKSAAENAYHYRFLKDTFAKTGITLAFGEAQKFNLDLTYHLKNENLVSARVEIALPPDIYGEQQIVMDGLTPRPLRVRVDKDGNYLAQYEVGARETLKVNLQGRAIIYHKAPPLKDSGLISDTPVKLQQEYTQPQKFWESADPQIKRIAGEETESRLSAAENARKLYDYVTANLNYGWEEIKKGALERQGAKKALQNKDAAVCMEFTDLLIALLRSAGIPARRLAGYAFSKNSRLQPLPSDSLHTWVQVYLAKIGWIGIDPTWGATTNGMDYFSKLDTNHIVFAVNGQNSETPYPAGTYKLNSEQTGDLKISFLDDDNYRPPPADLDLKQSSGKLIMTNISPVAALDLMVKLRRNGKVNEYFPGTLPPFSAQELLLASNGVENAEITLLYKDITGRLYEKAELVRKEPADANIYLKLGLCGVFFAGLALLAFRRKRRLPRLSS